VSLGERRHPAGQKKLRWRTKGIQSRAPERRTHQPSSLGHQRATVGPVHTGMRRARSWQTTPPGFREVRPQPTNGTSVSRSRGQRSCTAQPGLATAKVRTI
jgi:hypothetical protein